MGAGKVLGFGPIRLEKLHKHISCFTLELKICFWWVGVVESMDPSQMSCEFGTQGHVMVVITDSS